MSEVRSFDYFDEAINILKGKGIIVSNAEMGEAISTNMAKPPRITIWTKRGKELKPPALWIKLHKPDAAGNQIISCKFSFSEDHPITKEKIDEILEKRYIALYDWAKKLKVRRR